MIDTLFAQLDLDSDGEVSRSELHQAAKKLGWHWNEAPLLAVLDLFSIPGPISEQAFTEMMQLILDDPMEVYGGVLKRSPHFFPPARQVRRETSLDSRKKQPREAAKTYENNHVNDSPEELLGILERHADVHAAKAFRRLRESLGPKSIAEDEAALLIIDPQTSFTSGSWMQSMGGRGPGEVAPIRLAFENCARFLKIHYGHMAVMFTRCPFPPESYNWDERLRGILDPKQLYFVKPGNNVLFPPANGFKEWLESRFEIGNRVLIIGGCTLNSCVRVSAIEICRWLDDRPLEIVVDLSLCGARAGNFHPDNRYGGMSAVESAIRQMTAAGVSVVSYVKMLKTGDSSGLKL